MSEIILKKKSLLSKNNKLIEDFLSKAFFQTDEPFSHHAEKEIIKVINEKKDNIIFSN